MISALSTTNRYILQPGLIDMHQQSLNWLSAISLWNKELIFFQKLLDQHASSFTDIDDKKQIERFQNLILYYHGEVVGNLRSDLLEHERNLANTLKSFNESDTDYYAEHNGLMEELLVFEMHFTKFKNDFFEFIGKVI